MAGYLYGSSIQGIQKFIFETNKLVEIVGASELVEQLSNERFINEFGVKDDDLIMHAAGNIKMFTHDEELVKKIILNWPKIVAHEAPGIVVSQSVIEVKDKLKKEHFDALEKKLMTARNRQSVSQLVTPMAAIRSRRTGRAAVDWQDDDSKPRDMASKLKQEAGKNDAVQNLMNKCLGASTIKFKETYPSDVSDILPTNQQTGWLAVVHADGNSLGKLIQSIAKTLENNKEGLEKVFKEFSEALNQSTISATRQAIEQKVLNTKIESKKLPIRPVVVGGDDLTFIIRADLALPFTQLYLQKFQQETAKNFSKLVKKYSLNQLRDGITACAGIAFMKESFPFYYAADLAEQLCTEAKKQAKKIDENNIPSALMFHKIQDSFVDDYQEIVERELTAKDNLSFKFGPYNVSQGTDGLASLNELLDQAKLITQPDSPKSGIRKWLSLLHIDKNKANLWLERVKEITKPEYLHGLKLEQAIKNNKTHLYDVLTIASFINQKNARKD